MKRSLPYLAFATVVVVLDQLSKREIVHRLELYDRVDVSAFFSWVHARNYGAAFSMLDDAGGWQRWFFVALALGFTAFILYELRRLPPADRLMGWVYGLILGGAIGNLIDRLQYGYVVDFLLFHYGSWSFPAFNVADMALSLGAALWIYCMFRDAREANE
ncbi:MAG: signal peptidase II [Pseudomonadota bacterium]